MGYRMHMPGSGHQQAKPMNNTFLKFKELSATLNIDQLAVAYKTLYENNAPMQCLEVILDHIIDKEGSDYAEGLIEKLV